MRPHQWLKNLLIFVPLILAQHYSDPSALLACVIAFVSFSAAASAIYIVNDFFDLAVDRAHPTKRRRPFASGMLSIPTGFVAVAALLAVSVGAATFLPPLFGAALALYLVITTAYSLSLKRMLLIDVLTLAGLYTMRVLAGAPVPLDDLYSDEPSREAVKTATSRIMDAITDLVEQVRHETAPAGRWDARAGVPVPIR